MIEVEVVIEHSPYTCPEEILPTQYSLWAVAPFILILALGAFLDHFLRAEYATIVASFVVLLSALVMAHFFKRKKLSSFPCSNCGATSLEQSEDDENVLLICHSCQIKWVTNLTTANHDIEYSES